MTQHKPTPPAPLPPQPDVIAGAQAAGPLLEQALAQGQTVQQVFIRQLQQRPPRHEQHWYWLLCQLLALHAPMSPPKESNHDPV